MKWNGRERREVGGWIAALVKDEITTNRERKRDKTREKLGDHFIVCLDLRTRRRNVYRKWPKTQTERYANRCAYKGKKCHFCNTLHWNYDKWEWWQGPAFTWLFMMLPSHDDSCTSHLNIVHFDKTYTTEPSPESLCGLRYKPHSYSTPIIANTHFPITFRKDGQIRTKLRSCLFGQCSFEHVPYLQYWRQTESDFGFTLFTTTSILNPFTLYCSPLILTISDFVFSAFFTPIERFWCFINSNSFWSFSISGFTKVVRDNASFLL